MDAQEEEDMPTVSDRTRMVSQEAAYWYIRYTDEPMMPRRDKKLFLAWLKRSPENVTEILLLAELDGTFARQRLVDVVTGLEESNVYDINTGGIVSQYDYNPCKSVPDTVKTNAPPVWAMAAMIAAFTVVMLLGFAMLQKPAVGTVATAASQWQHMTLDDGSTVHMDARTRLKVEYSDKHRVVHLYDGWAVFEVAKNPDRPFTVKTDLVDVTAVGTRFGVAIDSGVTTTVSEGIVNVTSRDTQPGTSRLVHAGEEVRVSRDRDDHSVINSGSADDIDLTEVDVLKVDAERKLDWANGWLSFNGETIDEAVREFNRRNNLQIVIDDRSIGDRRLGVYRLHIDSTESFAKLLDGQEGIAVTKDDSRNQLHVKLE